MSLRTLLGGRAPLLDEGPEQRALHRARELLPLPVRAATSSRADPALDATFTTSRACAPRACGIADEARALVVRGARHRCCSPTQATGRSPIPMLLAVGAVHQRLVARGLPDARHARRRDSDEPREAHHLACLLGYGADAICPRLALETVAALAAADKARRRPPVAGGGAAPLPRGARGRRAEDHVEDGHCRCRGVPRRAALRGRSASRPEVIDLCLAGTPSPLGGIGFAELEDETLRAGGVGRRQLESPGYVKYRKGGEPHATTPRWSRPLQARRPRMRRRR